MAEAPLISVIIPTRHGLEELRGALRALGEQSLPGDAYEVVVAVDGASGGNAEMLAQLSTPYSLRGIDAPGRGRAAACNAAVAEARGEVLLVLDDDMEAAPELVQRHHRHHARDTRLCVLGAVPVVPDSASRGAARYVKEKFDLHLARLPDPEYLNLPRSFYTGNASLRAELVREVGGFDERFTVYGNEDVELALRLRAAGATLRYDPEAVARHRYRKDLRDLAADTLAKGRTTVLLARMHPEVFGALRLAAPGEGSRPWLAARAVLLRLTRRRAGFSRAVFAVASMLERLGSWRVPLFYRALLEYAFWAGVDAELGASDGGELAGLATELNRAPIDLLLHG